MLSNIEVTVHLLVCLFLIDDIFSNFSRLHFEFGSMYGFLAPNRTQLVGSNTKSFMTWL